MIVGERGRVPLRSDFELKPRVKVRESVGDRFPCVLLEMFIGSELDTKSTRMERETGGGLKSYLSRVFTISSKTNQIRALNHVLC